MYLSMIVIRGATMEAAANPETASEASLNPRFFVSHFFCSVAKGSATFEARVTVFDGSMVDGNSTSGVAGVISGSLGS